MPTPNATLRRAIAALLAAWVGAGAWGCDDPVFACNEHRECDDAGLGGVCEANGFCSFATDACASGRAFGELSPVSIAGRCVPVVDPCVGEACTDIDDPTRTPSTPPAGEPRREDHDDEPDAPDEPDDEPISADQTRHCSNGVRDDGESDIDCGGACLACDACRGCTTDDDCAAGTCDGGTCRTLAVIQLDWQIDCGSVDDLPTNIVLPPGEYIATALPSAGSRWNNDGANGGNTWAYRIDCTGGELDDLRSPDTGWFASPEEAFAGLPEVTTSVYVGSEGLACGHSDSYCPDNRGVIAVQLATACPSSP